MLFLYESGLVSLETLILYFFFCDELDGELGGLIDDEFISCLLSRARCLSLHDFIKHYGARVNVLYFQKFLANFYFASDYRMHF